MVNGVIKSAAGVAILAVVGASYLSDATGKGDAKGLSGAGGWFSSAPATPPAPAATAPQLRPALQSLGYGREQLKPDAGGQYHANVEIEGRLLPMLVDTGATLVSLTFEDAEKLGYAPAPADFTVPVQTANGLSKAANLTLREARLGTLMVSNVPAIVLPRGINGVSLLGMSFLKKLGGFEIASGDLIMRQ
jgi:aspartyl protease family protein